MKKSLKRFLLMAVGFLILGLGGVAWFGYSFLSPNSSRNRAAAMECTLAWGRLAPFPSSARQVQISTEGGMFSRAFRVSFTAPAEDIDRWLQQSAGTQEAQPSAPEPGRRHFEIQPGEGASHAEVTVDDDQHRVSIYVYWS
jgi:hypothetical protein